MSDRAIVSDRFQTDHRWILHGNGKKSRKDPLDGSSFLMEGFEGLASIVDTLADTRGQTDQGITPLLGDELGMGSRAEEMALSFLSEVNGAAILEVGDSLLFELHLPLSVHREIGLAVNVIPFDAIGVWLLGSRIARDDGLGFEPFDDEAKDILCVIDGISTHGFDGERESLLRVLEHGDGLMDFTHISGVCSFPEGDFLFGIGDDVISVAPEIPDLLLEGLREMDQEAQSSIGVSFGSSSFIESVGGAGGFEVVLPHLRKDRTGVHNKVFPTDGLLFKGHLYEFYANVLQN